MANSDRVVAENIDKPNIAVSVSSTELIRIAVIGALIGVASAGIMYLLNQYVFGSVMCRADSGMNCADAPSYSMIVASLIAALAGLIALVQIRSYRPLVVVAANVIAFWGFQSLISGLAWYWGLLIMAALTAISYVTFSWIVRLRSFVLALVVTAIVVVLVRLALAS